MASSTITRSLCHGAFAGIVAGAAGAAALYFLVEPSIRAAIAIEEATSEPAHVSGHTHASAELVTRGQQVVAGMLTAVIVGSLIGIAFALVHRCLGRRIAGRDLPGSSMILAGLGFVSFTLAPAIVAPANPPAVGDPATVGSRTLVYLGTIVCAVALTTLVVAVSRVASLSSRHRALSGAALAVVSVVVLKVALPDVSDPIPTSVPAGLIWEFRLGSLAALGSMWLVLAVVFGWLEATPQKESGALRQGSAPLDALTGSLKA
jgi:predicted cobalt transporter CbtA